MVFQFVYGMARSSIFHAKNVITLSPRSSGGRLLRTRKGVRYPPEEQEMKLVKLPKLLVLLAITIVPLGLSQTSFAEGRAPIDEEVGISCELDLSALDRMALAMQRKALLASRASEEVTSEDAVAVLLAELERKCLSADVEEVF